jgi:hypothetical protein
MNPYREKRVIRRAKAWHRAIRPLLTLTLALPLLAGSGWVPQSDPLLRVQPVLLELAARSPDAIAAIIVQKWSQDTSVENTVASLGGTVTKDLHIIDALGAELPARAVPELARSKNVRWISMDAPMESTTEDPVFITWATQPGSAVLSGSSADFNSTPINARTYLWFSAVIKVGGLGSGPTTIRTDDAVVSFRASGSDFTLPLPAASVEYSPTATTATTTYDSVEGEWITVVPSRLDGNNVFLTGLAVEVPINLPGSIKPVTWSGTFTSDTPGVTVSAWKWAAAAYSNLSTDYTTLGIKPCDDSSASQYRNGDKAGTPENFKTFVARGARGDGGSNYTGSYSSNKSVLPTTMFINSDNMLSTPAGPDGVYGHGSNVVASFGGFTAESSPDESILKVEAVLKAYVPTRLDGGDDTQLTVLVG